MSSDITSLLPPNATALERDIEQVTARLGQVPIPVDTLWNPLTCPAANLPLLAYAFSVDEWDPEWPTEIKRAVIAASVGVHLVKGSVASVRRVLAAVGVPAARLTEWWQTPADAVVALVHSTDRYTYTIGLDVASRTQPLTPALYSSIFRLLGHTQPARCGMALYLDARIGSAIGIGGAARLMQFARFTGADDPGITATQSLNLGSAARLMQFGRFVYRPLPAWRLTLDYTDAANPAPWALTLDYTDLANPALWALTLDYTDAADPAPWALTLDYTDHANLQPWVLTLDYTDHADVAPWVLTLDYSDQADLQPWVLTLDYSDAADLPVWHLTLNYTDNAEN